MIPFKVLIFVNTFILLDLFGLFDLLFVTKLRIVAIHRITTSPFLFLFFLGLFVLFRLFLIIVGAHWFPLGQVWR